MTDEEQNSAQPGPFVQLLTSRRPIVIGGKKRKKRKYSRGLKDLQEWGRAMARVSDGVARSAWKGTRAYRKASNKSARKKRDGAIRDYNLNVAKGISKSLRSSSSLPYDLARALN